MQKQFKPAPVYNPHVISKRPIEATLQRPVAKEPVFHTRIKPATTHPPVRRRSDTDIFYAKEPIKRGPVDLDKGEW